MSNAMIKSLIEPFVDDHGNGVVTHGTKQTKQWYKRHLLHRENNPAVIVGDDDKEFYLENNRLEQEDYWIRLLLMES